ncbi:hypothetical protein D049_2024A, partial [Vibrio parahaemolyticus VPTS-2010]
MVRRYQASDKGSG